LTAALLVTIGLFEATAQDRNPLEPTPDTSGLIFISSGCLRSKTADGANDRHFFARNADPNRWQIDTYRQSGRKWQASDFVLSGALETHDWRTEPMVLVSLGQLKEKLASIRPSAVFRLNNWLRQRNCSAHKRSHDLKRAEKTLDRVQQEALAVSDRLALLANVMNGSALLIVPASKSETDPWVVPPEFSRTTAKHSSRRSRSNCKQWHELCAG